MPKDRTSLKEAIKFHGHLGPYLILGLLAGEFALNKLKAKKYFGVEIRVFGANKKPKSCLIDGLQLSTGATYGKGNIKKYNAGAIKIVANNSKENKKVTLSLKNEVTGVLEALKGHSDSERFARKLLHKPIQQVFSIK